MAAEKIVAIKNAVFMTTAPTMAEHPDVLQILLGGAVLVVCFLCVRTLNKIDKNQTTLFKLIGDLQIKLYRLEGAHEAFHGKMKPLPGEDS